MAPSVSDTERPVPVWALRLAHAIPWMVLPVCVWRLPFAVNFQMGQIEDRVFPSLWIGIPYVFGLSLLTETAAWLCIGLVRRWGEVIPTRFPVVLSLTGIIGSVEYENMWWAALATTCLLVQAPWGPSVLALTFAYYVRRRTSIEERAASSAT